MSVKFYFNKDAWTNFAKQVRVASWGVSGLVSSGALHEKSTLLFIASGAVWIFFQACATALESIKEDKKGGKK